MDEERSDVQYRSMVLNVVGIRKMIFLILFCYLGQRMSLQYHSSLQAEWPMEGLWLLPGIGCRRHGHGFLLTYQEAPVHDNVKEACYGH